MSKATFYEHFGNKEECILALFDAAIDVVLEGSRRPRRATTAATRRRAASAPSVRAFLEVVDAFPDQAQTLLVEIIGAGPRAAERRDAALAARRRLHRRGQPRRRRGRASSPRLASPHDAFAIVGAIVELASRQLRTKDPADIRELEPVIERLVLGLVGAAPPPRERGLSRARSSPPRSGGHRAAARCPRLVEWREQVAREKRAAFRDWDYWGRPIPGFGDPARARADPRARARRARRQPHRPRVHRRPLGRLPVRRPAPHRLRQPADVGAPRRRPRAARLLHHRRRALRAAGQQAAAGRARALRGRGSSASWR